MEEMLPEWHCQRFHVILQLVTIPPKASQKLFAADHECYHNWTCLKFRIRIKSFHSKQYRPEEKTQLFRNEGLRKLHARGNGKTQRSASYPTSSTAMAITPDHERDLNRLGRPDTMQATSVKYHDLGHVIGQHCRDHVQTRKV